MKPPQNPVIRKTFIEGEIRWVFSWEHGPLFVRELVALATEPKPHFNTLSTMVRALEAKGYVAHNTFLGHEDELAYILPKYL